MSTMPVALKADPHSSELILPCLEVFANSSQEERKILLDDMAVATGDVSKTLAVVRGFLDRNYLLYLKTVTWKVRRALALTEGGYICAKCGTAGELQVDHLSYNRLGAERPEDLQVLCDSCHKAKDEAPRPAQKLAQADQYVTLQCPKCEATVRFKLDGDDPANAIKGCECGYTGIWAFQPIRKHCSYCGGTIDWHVVNGSWVPFNAEGPKERHRCQT